MQYLCSISTEFGPVHGAAGHKRGTGYRQHTDRVLHSSGSVFSYLDSREERNQQLPDWLERELLRQEPRRHSLTLGDVAKLSMRQRYRADPAGTLCELKVKVKGSRLCSICCLNGNLPQHYLSPATVCKLNVIMIYEEVGQLDRGTPQIPNIAFEIRV